jgi:pilus assembly protein CpaB
MNSRSLLLMLARISPIQMFVIIIGLSAGLTCLLSAELTRRTPQPEPSLASAAQKQRQSVLICMRDMAEGTTLCADDVATRLIEVERAPVDALTDSEAAVGRVIKFPVAAGTLLSMRDLVPLGSMGTGFQAKLRDGERAVTMAVDSTTGVAGFISPDSRVDVMVVVGAGAETKTRAILSDVRVVASGTTYQKQAGQEGAIPTSTVTVAVQPQDAAKVISAMNSGRIYLTLRSDKDHTPIAVSDVNSLFHRAKPVPEIVVANIPSPQLPPLDLPKVATPEEGVRNPMHEVELYTGTNRNIVSTPVQ